MTALLPSLLYDIDPAVIRRKEATDRQPAALSCGVASIAFVLPGAPQKRAALCAERGSTPITPAERSGSNDRQKKNDSHPGAGDRAGKAEAGASGQTVRPVPVRVSPAGGRWEAYGDVPSPAVSCPLSAGQCPAG